jgi:hypothetical protein
MATGRTSGVHTAVLTVPELQSPRALMPAMAATLPGRTAVLSHGRPHTQTGFSWRLKGEICPQNAVMAAATQVGRIAGYGSPVVTDSKFSTSMGPPSCSPPV